MRNLQHLRIVNESLQTYQEKIQSAGDKEGMPGEKELKIIFSNIDSIYDLHNGTILPELRQSKEIRSVEFVLHHFTRRYNLACDLIICHNIQ